MTALLGDCIPPTRPLNNYTIELLQKYPNLRVLRRCMEDGRCIFCIYCIDHHSQDNRITYRCIEYHAHSSRHKLPSLLYHPSTIYDTLTTNHYDWSIDSYTHTRGLVPGQNLLTVEEALPILEQEIMIGKL